MTKKLIPVLSAILVTAAIAAFSMTSVSADTSAADDSTLPSVEEMAGDIELAPESSMEGDMCRAADAAHEDPGVPAPSFKCIEGTECSTDFACGGGGYCSAGHCRCYI